MTLAKTRLDSRWQLLIVATIFSGVSLWITFASTGFLEADGVSHVIFAQATLKNVAHLFNFWGRPFKTLLMLPGAALGGVHGIRITCLLLSLACAGLAWAIGRKQHWPRPALAGVFVLVSPLLLLHSASELTEVPFATLLASAFLAYQYRQWMLCAFLVGLLPAARPEGLGALPVIAVVLACHRKWHAIPLLLVATLAWDLLGWHYSGQAGPWWKWLLDQFPYSATSVYGRKTPLVYVALMPVVIGPLLLLPLMLGIARQLRWRTLGRFFDSHRARCEASIALVPIGLTLVHAILTWRGLLGSNGEIRYLVIASPFWGLLCYRGFIVLSRSWRGWAKAIFIALCGITPVIIHQQYRCLPLVMTPEAQIGVEIARWYETWPRRGEFPKVVATHPHTALELKLEPTATSTQWMRERAPGQILLWDKLYGMFNSTTERIHTPREYLDAGWVEIELPSDISEMGFHAFVSDPAK